MKSSVGFHRKYLLLNLKTDCHLYTLFRTNGNLPSLTCEGPFLLIFLTSLESLMLSYLVWNKYKNSSKIRIALKEKISLYKEIEKESKMVDSRGTIEH
jgi:hypothetical protein